MDENNINNNDGAEMKKPSMPLTESHHSKLGPVLGVLVIVLVLVLAGLYLWGGLLTSDQAQIERQIVNNEPETPRTNTDIQILETLSPSDELEAIEADLDGTNLDSIDNDLTTMEVEFETGI